jgi:hypothetical protein
MFSSSAIAQSISGTVVDPSGNPKQGVAVILENKRGQSVNATSTSHSGTFDLRGIPMGDYILKIFSGNKILGTSDVTVSEKSTAEAPYKMNVGKVVVK